MSVTGMVAKTAVVLAVTGGLMALKARTLRQAILVVVFGLVLSIALFGRRNQPEPTKWLRLKTPEDLAWLLVAILTLGAVMLD